MKPEIPQVFTPDDIVATGLILAGYKLFPACHIALHPRMTVLSGNNAVGKTTILDAVQTILICHQQYINLNVATGQFDRSLAGQLSGRVGWAVLSISGHSEITAIGVRLHARAASEGLDLTPFAVTGIDPWPDLFLDREQSQIIPDFQKIRKNILQQNMEAVVTDFSSVDEYHRFLFAQGLLPVPMDRKGKKKFATLWSQVTRPKLDRLGYFLKEMLCPEPSQGVKFADVEKLMRDRRTISTQISSIEQFRRTRLQLEEQLKALDQSRCLYLSTELGMLSSRAESLKQKTAHEQKREQATVAGLEKIENSLEAAALEKQKLSRERDKYLGLQTELSRQERHHRQYQRLIQEQQNLAGEMDGLTRDISRAQGKVQNLKTGLREKSAARSELQAELRALSEKLKYISADKEKYQAFQKQLEKFQEKTGLRVKAWPALNQAWISSQKEKNRLESLPEMKVRLEEIRKRTDLHKKALELADWFERIHPDTRELLQGSRDEFVQAVNEWEDLDFGAEMARIRGSLDKLNSCITGLEKGRPGLPQALDPHLESGRLTPVAARYEHFNLEKAAAVQTGLGPFARAVLARDLEELAGLDLGDEEFLLLDPDVDPEGLTLFQAGQGVVAGQAGFYWYSPDSPVWLGAQARARELARLGQEKDSLLGRLQELENERRKNAQRISRARELAGIWSGLEDRTCLEEFEQLEGEISSLSQSSSRILETYQLAGSLVRKKDCFELKDAPAIYARTEKQAEQAEKDLKKLSRQISDLEKELAQAEQELGSLRDKYHSKDRRRAETKAGLDSLIKEEPMEVLLGRVDFSKARALHEQIKALDDQLVRLEKSRDRLHQEKGDQSGLLRLIQDKLDRLEKDFQTCLEQEKDILEKWRHVYPDRDPEYRRGSFARDDVTLLKSQWIQAEKLLESLITEISQEHSLQLPQQASSEARVEVILNNIIPQAVELDRVEEQLQHLRAELKQIESRIRTYVQDIKRKVDQEISNLKRRLDKVNKILADIKFGRISRVSVQLNYLPAYAGLKSLKGDRLTLLDLENKTTLEEFVNELVKNIFRQGQAGVSEEQIADYRTYISLSWSITDLDQEVRQKGFSGGETLGINLAICLGLLFHWGSESGSTQRGLLIMALDEAERLDQQAVHTVRQLLDRVQCQLLVALPRTITVPHTLCHMLTPLSQGVTHVSVYHKG
ncbi:MAG: SbcC/MukB-like Walker B domain-containing protein [Desulfonatronovibrionaceae bacterium]